MVRQSTKLVKKRGSEFLLLLLSRIESSTLRDLAKDIGRTKQDLNYHLQRLIKLKVLYREQSYPYSIYKLTSLGRRVKDSLIQSEHIKPLWKAHNLIVGFPIKSFGSFKFVNTSSRKIVPMNNWNYAREIQGEQIINVQDTGLLKIYCNEEVTLDPDLEFGKMYAEAQRIAQFYADRYGMKLEPMKVIRKGEKSLFRSELLTKILGRFKLPDIYVNASEGTEELEEPQDSYSIENILKLPEAVDNLGKKFDGGFNTISYLLTQQNELLSKVVELIGNKK